MLLCWEEADGSMIGSGGDWVKTTLHLRRSCGKENNLWGRFVLCGGSELWRISLAIFPYIEMMFMQKRKKEGERGERRENSEFSIHFATICAICH
jgi:hypothetical protein